MERKTIYVAGPVTGRKELNRPAFDRAAERLEAAGYRAMVPHAFAPDGEAHERAMRMTLQWMVRNADGVCTLADWGESAGARLEVEVAEAVGLTVGGIGFWECVAAGCPRDCRDCDELLYAGEGDWWCALLKRPVGENGHVPAPWEMGWSE